MKSVTRIPLQGKVSVTSVPFHGNSCNIRSAQGAQKTKGYYSVSGRKFRLLHWKVITFYHRFIRLS